MAMTEEEHEALIKRLEVYAHKHPAVYKLRVVLLCLLGYVYIVAVLANALMLSALLLKITGGIGSLPLLFSFGWVLLVFLGLTLRATWVRFPKPPGLALSYEDAPRLFDVVGELATALRAPSIHHILLTTDNHAAIMQRPRLGVFGWYANYLILGLPLMQTLSPEQYHAILAHELGHLSSQHGRIANWSQRLQQMWCQLLSGFEAKGRGGLGIHRAFFEPYLPFLEAYSSVLSRAHEYEADRWAANQSSARHLAEALLMRVISEHYLNAYFWPKLDMQVDKQGASLQDGFSTMVRLLPPQIEPNDAKIWLQEALLDKPDHLATHPALADRLSALGFPTDSAGGRIEVTPYLAMLVPARETAATHFLGKTVEKFMPDLSRLWEDDPKPDW